jgi:hypothetical protein
MEYLAFLWVTAMRVLRSISFFVLFALPVSVASAASITSTVSKDGKVIVSLVGEIVEGDTDTLKSIIKLANESGRFVSAIRLDSPGGSIMEGSNLAAIIRYGKIATSVISGAKCASACFIVFAAGNPKYVNYSALVGVHGASDDQGRETIQAGAATVSMARIVKDLGVPAPIIGKMVVTPPDSIVWLTPDDLRSMGTTMTGKPIQVPTGQIATPQPPTQLPPSTMATIPPTSTAKKAPEWKDLVSGAFALSARQNGGEARSGRVCQPELKLCNTAVFFRDKEGVEVMLRMSEDPNGKIVSRDVCEFNKFGDVRTCTDWDSGVSTREMKNKKGEWVEVNKE